MTAGHAAFALSSHADAFLCGHCVSNEDLLKVLHARLYTSTSIDFAHYVSIEIGWEQSEGEELWEMIKLPGA